MFFFFQQILFDWVLMSTQMKSLGEIIKGNLCKYVRKIKDEDRFCMMSNLKTILTFTNKQFKDIQSKDGDTIAPGVYNHRSTRMVIL